MNLRRPLIAGLALLLGAAGALAYVHGVYVAPVNAYFSSSTGNDSNPCTISSPCATIAKANSLTYGPGSTINLFAGDTFTTTVALTLEGVGGATPNVFGPITVQSYGGTCLPLAGTTAGCAIIQISGTNPVGIFLENLSNSFIQNLQIFGGTSTALTTDTGFGVEYQNASGFHDRLTLQNLEIKDFSDEIQTINLSGNYLHLAILNNYIHGTLNTTTIDYGVRIFGGYGHTVQGNYVNNIGSRASAADASTGTGILFISASNVLDQFNVTSNYAANSTTCGGPYGNWAYESTNITFQFNEAFNGGSTTAAGTACDEGAFDLDGGVSYSTVQYSYGHAVNGPGVLFFASSAGGFSWIRNVARYNIFEELTAGRPNLVGQAMAIGGGGGLGYFYNNTYATDYDAASDNGQGACLYSIITNARLVFANNICYNSGASGHARFMTIGGTNNVNMKLVNNNYYRVVHNNSTFSSYQFSFTLFTTLAAFQGGFGEEQGSITTNPTLSNALANSTCYSSGVPSTPQPCPTGYTLSSGSPNVGTGLNLTSAFGLNVGKRDYYGNVIPNGTGTGYNIGADGSNPANACSPGAIDLSLSTGCNLPQFFKRNFP